MSILTIGCGAERGTGGHTGLWDDENIAETD